MATDLATLIIRLEANDAKLQKGLDRANTRIKRFEVNTKKSLTAFSKHFKRAFAIGGLAGLAASARSAISFADAIDKAAQAAGVSSVFLQEMRYAGEQLGVSVRQTDDGLRRFNRRLGEFASTGKGPVAETLKRLKIDVNDMNDQFRGTEAIFYDFVKAFEGFESQAEISAVAAKAFGDDAGPIMALALSKGVDALDSYGKKAHDLGIILSDDVVQSMVKAQDASTTLSRIIGVQLARTFAVLGPHIVTVTKALADFSEVLQDIFKRTKDKSGFELIDESIEVITNRIDFLKKGLDESLFSGLKTEKAREALKKLEKTLDDLHKKRSQLEELEKSKSPTSFPSGGGGGDDGGAADKTAKSLISLQARLNPLQAAVIKFNKELAVIKASDLGADKKIELVQKLQKEFATSTAEVRKFRDQGTEDFDALKDRLFPLQGAARQFNRELALIKRSTSAGPDQDRLTQQLEKNFADATGGARKLKGEMDQIGDGALDMGFAFESAFEEAVLGGEAFSDVLNGLLKDLEKVVLRQLITAPLGQALSSGISQTYPGFASGGSFTVGGSGGTDSQLVAFRASPGERVDVSKAAGSGTVVNVTNNSGAKTDIKRSNDPSGREVVNIMIGQVARDIASGGAVAQAMQNSFGVRRQGIVRS